MICGPSGQHTKKDMRVRAIGQSNKRSNKGYTDSLCGVHKHIGNGAATPRMHDVFADSSSSLGRELRGDVSKTPSKSWGASRCPAHAFLDPWTPGPWTPGLNTLLLSLCVCFVGPGIAALCGYLSACPRFNCLCPPMFGAFTLLPSVVPIFGHCTFLLFGFYRTTGNCSTWNSSSPSTLRGLHLAHTHSEGQPPPPPP